MKRFIALQVAAFLLGASALGAVPNHCSEVPEGFHEWAAFGEKSVYLSHFPMFGSVHSYQVIVEAALSIGGRDASPLFFESERSHPGLSYTISPVSPRDATPAYWILPDRVSEGMSFDARLHFSDAAGKDVEVLPRVRVTVRHVLVNRIMRSEDRRPAWLPYYYFGSASEAYLAHAMTWDPDFDQIIRVPAEQIPVSCLGRAQLIGIRNAQNVEAGRLKPGVEQLATASCASTEFRIKPGEELMEYKISIQR